MRRFSLLIALLVFAACSGKDDPVSPNSVVDFDRGTLAGVVTIGPNCPGPQTNQGCPTPPSAYLARKVLVYNTAKTELLHTVDIDTLGNYLIVLPVGQYVVDLKGSGADHSASVPATVTIQHSVTTKLDIDVDTGIR